MTKRIVICPICKINLGKFHNNASQTPVRNHIFEFHKEQWEEIIALVNRANNTLDLLSEKYDIGYWDMIYYHEGVKNEIDFDNRPSLTEDQITSIRSKLLKD